MHLRRGTIPLCNQASQQLRPLVKQPRTIRLVNGTRAVYDPTLSFDAFQVNIPGGSLQDHFSRNM